MPTPLEMVFSSRIEVLCVRVALVKSTSRSRDAAAVSELNPFLFGNGPAFLSIVAACCALLSLPIYFWVADKRRRGESVRVLGLVGSALIGTAGVLAVWLFLFARR
jgi:hypothetical protein